MSTVTAAATRVGGETLGRDFEGIFQAHGPFVYRTAYTVTGNREDAEDVVQTIFMSLLERSLPSALIRNPRAYLYRAAINTALNVMRTRRRRNLRDDVDLRETPAIAVPPEPDFLMRRRLLDAIARLKPDAVEILILRYEHGYSDAEIAQMLGKSRTAVAVALTRTRAQLRRLLEASSGENR